MRPMKASSWLVPPMLDWVEHEDCSALMSRTTNEGKQAAYTARPKSAFSRPWRSFNPFGPFGWAWCGLTKQRHVYEAHVYEAPPISGSAGSAPAKIEGPVQVGSGKSFVESVTENNKGKAEQLIKVHRESKLRSKMTVPPGQGASEDETLPDFSDSASELSSHGDDELHLQVLCLTRKHQDCVADKKLSVAQARIAVMEADVAEAQSGRAAADERTATAVAALMTAEGRIAELEAEKQAAAAHASCVGAEEEKAQKSVATTAVEKATGHGHDPVFLLKRKEGQLKASQEKVHDLEDKMDRQAAEMEFQRMQVKENDHLRKLVETLKGQLAWGISLEVAS